MEFDKVVQLRRSVRTYNGKAVSKDQIETLINSAILAPSWKNSQTARYYVILDDEKKKAFAEKCLPLFNQKNSQGAGALVITTFVKNRSGFEKTGEPTNEAGNLWGAYDLGLHNENFLLKAKEMGLDTVVMGIRDESEIRKFLDVPDEELIIAVIALGYSDVEASMPKRKTPDDIVKFV